MILISGKRQFGVALGIKVGSASYPGSLTFLESVDGKRLDDNPTMFREPIIEHRKRHTVLCEVRRERVRILVDNRRVIDWTGNPNQLSLHSDLKLPQTQVLGLVSSFSEFVFHEILLIPVTTKNDKGQGAVTLPVAKPPTANAPFSTDKAKQHQQAWAEYLGVPVTFENSIGMKFSLIPPGEFHMGGGSESEDEIPGNGNVRHRVTLTKPYYLGIYETRQRDFQTVAGRNPSKFSPTDGGSLDHPVESVPLSDIEDFCRKLSSVAGEKDTGRLYRLPTEAEWEHACRAGTITRFSFGETITRAQANLKGTGNEPPAPIGMTTRVGSYPSNAWGLFDMYGNIAEWTSDFKGSFNRQPVVDPRGPASDAFQVYKGGALDTPTPDPHASSGMRYYGGRGVAGPTISFRVVLEVPADAATRQSQFRASK